MKAGWDPQARKTLRLIKQMEKRIRHAIGKIPHDLATEARNLLLENLSGEVDAADLRSGLRVGGFSAGDSQGAATYYRPSSRPKRKVRAADPATSVIYVRRIKGLTTKLDDATEVLIRNSPWTLDTIPFFPKRKEAALVVRKLDVRRVSALREDVIARAPQWQSQFLKVGKRVPRPKKQVIPRTTAVVSDLGFQVLKRESGEEGKPFLRKALKEMKRKLRSSFWKTKRAKDFFLNPCYSGWKKPIAYRSRITPSALAQWKTFQKRLKLG